MATILPREISVFAQQIRYVKWYNIPPMKNLVRVFFLSMPLTCIAASLVVVPTLPKSNYVDFEVSTNIAFRTDKIGVKVLEVRIEFAGSESNCVEVAFGRDADGNGDLSPEEMRFLLGWRGGRRFVEDVASDERRYEDAEPVSGRRFLALSVETGGERFPRKPAFTCESGPCFTSLAADAPRFPWDSTWNIAKIVRRGTDAADEWCKIRYDGPLFVMMVR